VISCIQHDDVITLQEAGVSLTLRGATACNSTGVNTSVWAVTHCSDWAGLTWTDWHPWSTCTQHNHHTPHFTCLHRSQSFPDT